MTERFNINPSMMVTGKYVIIDELGQYTFPVLEPTMNHMFCKALNELNDENKQLKLQSSEFEITLMNNQLAYNDLEKENEGLKSICQDHRDHAIDFKADCERLEKENEQLKQQIKIFEKFLEVGDLDIDWEDFCGVDECAFENPDFCCQECIHLKGDVE